MSGFEILEGENCISFIKDINVKDLGQTAIIEFAVDYEKELNHRVVCRQCEKVEIDFNKEVSDRIDEDGYMPVLEFSIKKQPNDKKSVYVYALPIELELVCKSIQLEKDW